MPLPEEEAPSDDVATWLAAAKAVLLAEGFRRDPRQARKPGQVWGVIRQEPDDLQLHVRAFRDGRLESEVELSNKYVQHLWSKRRNASPEIKEILGRNGLPTHQVSETFLPITGAQEDKRMPTGRTRSRTVAVEVAVGLVVLLGQAYLKRVVLRRLGRGPGAVLKR
ncbi:MAG: hypothetical protein ACPGQL_00255 [Thermoplasmatota archaeon]